MPQRRMFSRLRQQRSGVWCERPSVPLVIEFVQQSTNSVTQADTPTRHPEWHPTEHAVGHSDAEPLTQGDLLLRIFRIAIPASQIGRSRQFYEDLLGIDADDTVPSRLYFHCDDVIVAVIDWAVEPLGPFQSTPENLYFATDALEAVHQRASNARARQLSAIETRPWGERSFYCLDPDGNRLCFVDATTLFVGRGQAWS